MNSKVDIYIASLWRQGHVVNTVNSILLNPEAEKITISCNLYTDEQWGYVNNELRNSKIKLHRTNNEKCSNEKLKYINNGNSPYIALIDDDLIYPSDYLKKLIDGCEKYQGHVSLHGVILNPRPIRSYYHNRIVYRGLGNVNEDVKVDIIGSGTLLFKREWYDDLDEWYDRCSNVSMDDIYVSFFARSKNIPRYVLAHKEGYLKHKEIKKEENYVFDKYVNNDKVQTDFINIYF